MLAVVVICTANRDEAVHRRDIFDRVWSDVVVSDSASSQAIRTLRRTLGEDPREPRFIRTVSRHGYRFAFPDVIEEDDTTRGRAAHRMLRLKQRAPRRPLKHSAVRIHRSRAGEHEDQE